ncbi:AraC family transcriptional regulator [Lentzea nigeriaca]|uniref:AraC family transcriptional regulator n=1 Tax=Lentzea nigeriaca TaxID=1128665 RepID=UPI00195D1F6E|nr:AraC family transcriptional regulator [Lentzea nigeriaca]MBM7863118.1 AraC-like DNA-binding protein [Lentzea nigeriaca]
MAEQFVASGVRPRQLGHWNRFATPDPDDAQSRTEGLLGCSHQFTVLERSTPFLAQIAHASLGSVGLLRSRYGVEVEITCDPPIPLVTVSLVRSGHITVTKEHGDKMDIDAGHAAVLSYDQSVRMRWTATTEQVMLVLTKSAVVDALERMLQRPLGNDLVFDTELDIRNLGQGVIGAVATLAQVISALPAGVKPGPVTAELAGSVVTQLLLAHRHNYTEKLFADQPLPPSRVVRRVIDFIDASDGAQLRLADLTDCADLSARSLHNAFKRHVGMSPMSYVRRRRLQQAHDELLRSDPGNGVTVTDVALRFGFNHTGRFAAAYRERFGESPSATLAR